MTQVYGATSDREDMSCRVILRADGQVVGGPPVRQTKDVKWSDPEGLRPVGGMWEIYKHEETGRTRLSFTIILSFQKDQKLEMDGTVMMVDGFNEKTGESEQQPHVFGSVRKLEGERSAKGTLGDFSMKKIVTSNDDNLVATVGSNPQRLW